MGEIIKAINNKYKNKVQNINVNHLMFYIYRKLLIFT